MKPSSPWLASNIRAVFGVLTIVFAIAATSLFAQISSFDPSFDGELWGVRRQITPANGGRPAGVAFSGGTMFVADSENQTVLAYNSAGQLVTINNADWHTADPLSPVAGLIPHQLTAVTVRVNGADRDALLVSDAVSNRVAAFRSTGQYLFTLRLQRPIGTPALSLSIGQMAMSSGSRFNLTTATSSLTLTGSFAAAWAEQAMTGEIYSGALVYQQATAGFALAGAEFVATSTAVLTGTEGNPVAPAPQRFFGLTFDASGNLYALDAFTERLHVYGPDLSRLFTFGTPVADGTTAEFSEPWGLAFWPDATGGRLFVNDTYNNRISIYRPIDGADAGSVIDGLQLEGVIKNFVAAAPAIELFSIALEPSSGTIAVTDFAELSENAVPRVVVLQKPRLAAFNVQVLNAAGAAVGSVCTAAEYRIRFSLTVPAGVADVTGVTPQLSIGGVPAAVAPTGATFPTTITGGQVATYTYTVTAPAEAGDDLLAFAGATATNTTDIMFRSELISLSDCAGETDPSTITAVPSTPSQVSGWTPIFEGDSFAVTLIAQDDDGIKSIQYELSGANSTGDDPVTTTFDGVATDADLNVAFVEFGRTTLRYRVRDGNSIWSGWQTVELRTKPVLNRMTNENVAVEFRVGDPEGTGFSYSVTGLPAGVSFSAATGQFAGVISFDAVQPYSADPVVASGVYSVVVTETASGGATSSVAFTWTINHVNREPIITTPVPAGLSIQQGQDFSLKIDGYDPDGDPLIFTVVGRSPSGQELPQSVTIDPVTGLISGAFPFYAETSYALIVGLAECSALTPTPPCNQPSLPGTHLATLLGFDVAVLDANLSPDVVNPGPQLSAEGAVVTLPITASDAEGDDLTFAASGLPAGLSIDPGTGLISGTVTFDAAGPHAVTVAVDDHVNTPVRSVTFSWEVTGTNRPPAISIPDRDNWEGQTLNPGVSLAPFASDPDGTAVTFVSANGLPPGIVMTPGGALSGSLDYNAAGSYPVTIRVSDGTAFTDDTFTWTVFNVNRPPTLTPVNQFSREGDIVAYQLPAGDPDGDALIFSINGLPPGLTLNTTTGLISGTVPPNSTGTYAVNIGVADDVPSGSHSLLRKITWTITTNRPPAATADTATVMQGASVSIDVRSNDTDPDNDPLTIINVTAPTNGGLAVINVIGGTITFTATSPTFLGTSTFSYTIGDGLASATATVTVTITPSNAPPACTAAIGGEIWPPNHKRFYAAPIGGVTDPDGNPITITVTGIWQDEPIDSTGDGQFAPDGRIENGQAWIRAERNGLGNTARGNGRVYEILFSASDGQGGSCNGSVFWTVPHNQGQGSTAIDDGVRYDSTGSVAGARNTSQIHQKSPQP